MTQTPRDAHRIAMVAHDNKKIDLLRWADFNRLTLSQHELFATGTTGSMLAYELGLEVTAFLSGPVGGDQQIGAKIAEGAIDERLQRTADHCIAIERMVMQVMSRDADPE